MRRILMAVGCCVLIYPAQVGAVTVGFDPLSQTVAPNDSLDVSVVISGLESAGLSEIVSAYTLFVQFDETVLKPTGVSFGGFLSPSFQSADLSFLPGVLSINEASLVVSDPVLQAAQPDTFSLAILTFEALRPGMSPLTFLAPSEVLQGNPIDRVDVKGLAALILDPLTAQDGQVNVRVAVDAIPEPGTLLLVGSGLIGLLARRRSKRGQTPGEMS